MALDRPNIKTILQILQGSRIVINNSDVVCFTGQISGNRCTDLTGTQNYDLHELLNILAVLMFHISVRHDLLLDAFLVINTKCTQLPVQMGAFHSNPRCKFANTTTNFTQLVHQIIVFELLACFAQR